MSDKISKYDLKRTTAFNRLKETYDIGVAISSDNSQKSIFLARVETIDKVYEDFMTYHNQIISLISDEDFKKYDALRISADNAFYGSKAIKYQIVGDNSLTNNSTNVSTPKITAKLPKITLPIFEGDFKSPIDLLVGAELVPHILRSGRVLGEPGQPVALETIFGYILQGMAVSDHVPLHNSTLLSCHTSIESNLDIQLQKFWEVEEIPKISSLSTEDVQCEEIYRSLTYRDQSGRFCVPLPFKIPNPFFRNTCYQARRLFTSLEFRLAKNPELRKAYCEFMQDYLNNGHMVLIPPEDYNSPTAYYIPHHSVIKNEISGPKLRVVFNASFRDTNGTSLNDSLFIGPKLQQDIASILLTFRFHLYVFICDIKQMYRQILIQPQFQNFQRIIWRFSSDEPIQEYKLLTVTYGVSSAPYLALRTLQELANQGESHFPLAAKAIKKNIYIDDAICGAKI
ncbi:uncharacterized protein LOC115884583 [Sitophilus oryzae]|uniref:Uncharacterized protein LOC115884583 n=1 Tax=Sitophilus oryzae TaxID=7048 RepID=A0A6J2Y774_SITOR|nr:uncharacterized protein LOC115884583 [Sitophilus oryzae]